MRWFLRHLNLRATFIALIALVSLTTISFLLLQHVHDENSGSSSGAHPFTKSSAASQSSSSNSASLKTNSGNPNAAAASPESESYAAQLLYYKMKKERKQKLKMLNEQFIFSKSRRSQNLSSKSIQLYYDADRFQFLTDKSLIRPNVNYQLHSWNDLDEWHQSVLKGATYFKVDLFYVADISLCQRKARTEASVSTYGCFLLTHDEPLAHESEKYFSSDDLLQWLVDNRDLIKNSKLYIALCFKYYRERYGMLSRNPCAPKDHSWISLVDNLFANYNKAIAAYKLDIEMILDEAGTAGMERLCLIDKWRPWNYTFISARDPLQAMISNDQSEGLDRYQYLNEAVPGGARHLMFITRAKKVRYGKYLNADRPILLWEPSSQRIIWSVLEKYVEAQGPLHKHGLRFSINFDPIHFQIYAASRGDYNWNKRIKGSRGASNPKIVVIPIRTNTISHTLVVNNMEEKGSYIEMEANYAILSVFQKPQDSMMGRNKDGAYTRVAGSIEENDTPTESQTYYQISVTSSLNESPLKSIFVTPKVFPDSKQGSTLVSIRLLDQVEEDTDHRVLAATWDSGEVTLLNFDLDMLDLSEYTKETWKPVKARTARKASTKRYLDSIIAANGRLVVRLVLDTSSNSLSLQAADISAGSSDTTFIKIETQVTDTIERAAISSEIVTQEDGEAPKIVLVFSTSTKRVYTGIITIDWNSKTATYTGDAYLGRGTHPTIAINSDHLQNPIVTMLWQDGTCGNSDTFNIKFGYKICSMFPKQDEPLSCPMVLQYLVVGLNELQLQIESNANLQHSRSSNPTPLFTVCSKNALMGTFDRGFNPNVLLAEVPPSLNGNKAKKYIVLSVHEGVSKAKQKDYFEKLEAEIEENQREQAMKEPERRNEMLGWLSRNGNNAKKEPEEKTYIMDAVDKKLGSCLCGMAVPYAGLILDSWDIPETFLSFVSESSNN